MLELRDYQQAGAEEILDGNRGSVRRQILSMPTGAGKTETAQHVIEQSCTPERPALVIVEREVLIQQTKRRFERHDHLVGILQGENTFMRGYEPVVVSTIQTLRARWNKEIRRGAGLTGQEFVAKAGLVVVDECHIFHEHHARLLDQLNPAVPALGLSATPLREGLGKYFQRVVMPTTIKELQARGFLVRSKCFAPSKHDIATALNGIGIRGGDYIESQLSELMRNRAIIGDVVESWKTRAEGKPTLCFCVDRAHARELSEAFQAAGISAGYIDMNTEPEARQEAYERLRNGTLKALCSVGVLSVGFDEPCATVAMLCRPTMSLSLYIQQAGRVLRPYHGKDHALILDHAANTWRHGLPEEFTPPRDLSLIDAGWDKKTRADHHDLTTCKNCTAVFSTDLVTCPECGYRRIRRTAAIWLDGHLTEVDLDAHPEQAALGVSHERLRAEFRMMLYICEDRGWKRGAACFRLRERYDLPAEAMPKLWYYDDPLPPDDSFERWFSGDQRRRIIAWRKGKEKEDAPV